MISELRVKFTSSKANLLKIVDARCLFEVFSLFYTFSIDRLTTGCGVICHERKQKGMSTLTY